MIQQHANAVVSAHLRRRVVLCPSCKKRNLRVSEVEVCGPDEPRRFKITCLCGEDGWAELPA